MKILQPFFISIQPKFGSTRPEWDKVKLKVFGGFNLARFAWQNGAFTPGGFGPMRICLESDKMEYIAPIELWLDLKMEEGHFLILDHDAKCFIVMKITIFLKY